MLSRDTKSLGKLAKLARRGVDQCRCLVRISSNWNPLAWFWMGGVPLLLPGPDGGKVCVFSLAGFALAWAEVRIWLWSSN